MKILLRLIYVAYITFVASLAIALLFPIMILAFIIGLPAYILTGSDIGERMVVGDTMFMFPMGPMKVHEFGEFIERY